MEINIEEYESAFELYNDLRGIFEGRSLRHQFACEAKFLGFSLKEIKQVLTFTEE